MLLNYLKLAIRLLARTPFISMINIGGLSVGFTAFFILWLYTQNELKTDQFNKNWQNTYRFGAICNDLGCDYVCFDSISPLEGRSYQSSRLVAL